VVILILINIFSFFTNYVESFVYATISPLNYHFNKTTTVFLERMFSQHQFPILLFKMELLLVSVVIIFYLTSNQFNKYLEKIILEKKNIFYFLILVSLIPFWSFKFIPTSDGPNHLLQSHILREYNNPKYNYSSFFEVNKRINPNMFFHVFMFLLKPFDLFISEKIFLSLVMVLTPFSVYYFLKSFGKTCGKEFISFLFLYTIPLSTGFYNYLIGIPFIFFTLGFYKRNTGNFNRKTMIYLLLLFFLCYLSHIFSFVFALTVILLINFFKGDKRKKIYLSAVIPSLLVIVVFLLLPFYQIIDFFENPSLPFDASGYPNFLTKIYKLYRHFIPYSIVGGFTTLMLVLLLIYVFEYVKPGSENIEFLKLSLIFFTLYVLIPTKLNKGYIGIRFITPAFFLLLPWIKIKTEHQGVLISLISVVLCFIVANHVYFYSDYNQLLTEFTSGLDYVKPNKMFFPIINFDKQKHNSIGTDPLIFSASYYVIEKGDVMPGVFTSSTGYPLLYRDSKKCKHPLCLDMPEGFPIPVIQNCMQERYYDYILTWDYEFQALNCNNFKLIHEDGELRIYEKI
jgi:hypothetical protein